jgi:hypothetical protein
MKFTALLTCFVLLAALAARADWRDWAEFPQLQAELGASLPTGAGIPAMMSEASLAPSTEPPLYLPQATSGTADFAGEGVLLGKTITPWSGDSSASGHAASVAGYFCGSLQSVAPGVSELHVWWADEFAGEIYYGAPIRSFPGSVQNHSWVGEDTDDGVNTEFLRRFDFMVNRDLVVATTPLNNGGAMVKWLANAYHGITPGLRNGNHPHTHSNLDGIGRMKPDIVVEEAYTSLAAPAVASVATLLLDAIRPGFPDADDPRVLKAILLSGASKQNLLGWKRTGTSRPYDEIHGAGELNVLNAYHILAADRQSASGIDYRALRGWDKATSSTANPRRYFFKLLPGQWGTISATITWHRTIPGNYASSTLANLNLHLKNASGFSVGTTVDESVSAVDNVEHLFLRHLPPGDYALEVSAVTPNVAYGIAWEVQTNSGPQLTAQRDGSQITLSLSQLDPLETYTIESCTDLEDWQPVTTIRTADTTPTTTATWQETTSAEAKFYQLKWTP